MLHDIGILLVLVIWSICLYDPIHAINGAWYAVRGDEFGEVAVAWLAGQST